MICPNCGASMQSKITDSRERSGGVWRRRTCLICDYRYSTWEKIAEVYKTDVLPFVALEKWTEAIWLETKHELIPTAIEEVGPYLVKFMNGRVLMRKDYLKEWRVWSGRPDSKLLRRARTLKNK